MIFLSNLSCFFFLKLFKVIIFLAGLPTYIELLSIFPETTLPAPIITLSPIMLPFKMTVLTPIKQLLPIITGATPPKHSPYIVEITDQEKS